MNDREQRSRWVWIFHGEGSRLASAVFDSEENASRWIAEHHVSGLLTAYPLNEGAYNWAVREGKFVPKQQEHESPQFIQRFSSAFQPHQHFEDGQCS